MESEEIHVAIWSDMIERSIHDHIAVWRITQTDGPEDISGPIDLGTGPLLHFFEREEAEAFARKRGWIVDPVQFRK